MNVNDVIKELKPRYVRKRPVIKLNERLNELLKEENISRNDLIKQAIKIVGSESTNLTNINSTKDFNQRYYQLLNYLNQQYSEDTFCIFLGLLLYLLDNYLFQGVSPEEAN